MHPLLEDFVLNNSDNNFQRFVINRLLTINNLDLFEEYSLLCNLPELNKLQSKKIIQLGDQFLNNNKFDMALKCYKRVNHKSLNTAICYYKLFDYKSALPILQKFKTDDNPPPLVFFILAGIYFYKGNKKKSLQHCNMINFNELDEAQYWKFKLIQLNCLQELQMNVEIKSELKRFSKMKSISKHSQLMILRIKSMINIRTPLGINAEKHNLNGLTLSKKLKNPDAEVYFNSCLMIYFIHQKDLFQIEKYANRLLQYSRNYSDFTHAFNAYKCLGIAYARSNDKYKSIHSYNKAIEVAKKAGFKGELSGLNLSLGMAWDNIGHQNNSKLFYSASFKIKSNSVISQIQKSKINALVVGKLNPQKAEIILTETIKLAKKYQISIDIASCNLHLNNFALNGYNIIENEDKYWNAREKYKKLDRQNSLYSFDHNRVLQLVKYNYSKQIQRIILNWIGEKNKHYKISKILELMSSGSINGCISHLYDLENEFDGSYLHLHLQLYETLLSNPVFSNNQKEKFKFIYDLIFNISHEIVGELNIKLLKKYSQSRIIKILYFWLKSISQNKIAIKDELYNLIEDENQRKNVSEYLKLWDIQIISNTQVENRKVPILIQLLGKPQLWINGKELDRKYWKVRKSLELLIYLILKTKKYKSKISVNEFYNDILEISPNNWDKRIEQKNVILYRLNSIYNIIEEKLIINGGEFLEFNWDSKSFKLDIENFDMFYLKGMEAFEENNVDVS